MAITPFKKQLFVAISPMLAAISVGGATSYPIVLLHQLRGTDSSIKLDFDMSSWIGSINGIAGIPSIFLPNIMQWRGRKFAFLFACVISIFGWIIAYNANSATALLVSESFHGFGSNSILAVSCLSLSEMMSTEYRHTFMNLYSVLQTITMALNGILAQYVHWRIISIIMCIPMVIALFMASTWPESPYWLAFKGQYNKCEKSFVWLRGTDEASKREMLELINTHKDNETRSIDKFSLRKILKKISGRDFYMPCLHMILLQYLFYWSGNFVILIYSIDLIQKTTLNSAASFYGALIMNMILCFGIVTNIFLLRFFNKKSILLLFSILASLSMLGASLVCLSQKVGFLPKGSLLSLFALVSYMIANGTGIVPIAYAMAVEIMPVKHRGIGGSLIVIFSCIFHTASLKISPYLFLHIDLWGTFMFYSFNALVCAILIWRYVPDTTGRTLQEIELYYKYGRFVRGSQSQGNIEHAPDEKQMTTFRFTHSDM